VRGMPPGTPQKRMQGEKTRIMETAGLQDSKREGNDLGRDPKNPILRCTGPSRGKDKNRVPEGSKKKTFQAERDKRGGGVKDQEEYLLLRGLWFWPGFLDGRRSPPKREEW